MSKLETRKVTPYKDKSWYVKWVSSFILLIGMALTSADIQPINLFFHLIGVIGWGLVGFWWHDRAMLFINIIAATIFCTVMTASFLILIPPLRNCFTTV